MGHADHRSVDTAQHEADVGQLPVDGARKNRGMTVCIEERNDTEAEGTSIAMGRGRIRDRSRLNSDMLTGLDLLLCIKIGKGDLVPLHITTLALLQLLNICLVLTVSTRHDTWLVLIRTNDLLCLPILVKVRALATPAFNCTSF